MHQINNQLDMTLEIITTKEMEITTWMKGPDKKITMSHIKTTNNHKTIKAKETIIKAEITMNNTGGNPWI